MPELPEVETIRRDLEVLLVGRRIGAVKVFLAKPLGDYPPERFAARLKGARFTGVGRRAKILIFDFDSGDRMLAHLKMSGRLTIGPAEEPTAKHTHVVFSLDNESDLRFTDMRRFGYLKLIEGGDLASLPELKHLGPEPLASDFSEADFSAMIDSKSGSRRAVKGLLIDQRFLAGIGNLYADEILHAAKVRPERPPGSLQPAEVKRIYKAMQAILTKAIEARGTSFDLYVDAAGRPGAYLAQLQVYGRGGHDCFKCGGSLSKIRVAGRGTNFCPRCQK